MRKKRKKRKNVKNFLFDDKAKIRIWIRIWKTAGSKSMQYDDGVKVRTSSGSIGLSLGYTDTL
jgi:hypothetical protein